MSVRHERLFTALSDLYERLKRRELEAVANDVEEVVKLFADTPTARDDDRLRVLHAQCTKLAAELSTQVVAELKSNAVSRRATAAYNDHPNDHD